MTRDAIEGLAQDVLATARMRPPVNLDALCADEGIELAPGTYSAKFHGRIEYLPEHGIFVVYHPEARPAIEGRVRFTIAHELGHYFIPDHQALIIANRVHNSVESFAPVKNRIEKEADQFAASLLMPARYVADLCANRGYLDLAGLDRMARECVVSPVAAGFRYAELAEEPCVIVLSAGGVIRYAFHSEEACGRGFGGLGIREIPPSSAAARCLTGGPDARVNGATDTAVWFSGRPNFARLWEESMRFGATDRVVTMLSWQDYKPD